MSTLTPYAHPREPLRVGAYALGVFAPGLLLGLLPCVVAILAGFPTLFLAGLLMVALAGGDLLILCLLRKARSGDWVIDHPTRAGCRLSRGALPPSERLP